MMMEAHKSEPSICFNLDCMEGMKAFPDKLFDLAVVDPPYFSGPERRWYYGSRVSKTGVHRDYPITPKWDVPGKDYFDELLRFLTAKLLQPTCLILSACSGICGTA